MDDFLTSIMKGFLWITMPLAILGPYISIIIDDLDEKVKRRNNNFIVDEKGRIIWLKGDK